MRVQEIRQPAELQPLRQAWDTLLRESASGNIFLSWEWVTAWWSAYGVPGELRVLAAFDENNVLRGVAPMRSRTERRYGQTVPVLAFLGDGSNDSDYLDFMVAVRLRRTGDRGVLAPLGGSHWSTARSCSGTRSPRPRRTCRS